jgi:ABC-type transport system involved in multi-copper enzyme maturation permease subunit
MDSPKKRDRAESRRALWAVVQREMRETAWRKRTFFTRALTVLLLASAFVLMVSDLKTLGTAGSVILSYMAFTLTLFMAMILPILVGDVIAAEHERGTLGLLFLTRLQPIGIVLGKTTGRLLLILSFVFACAPVVALTYLLGGVEAADILKVMVAAICSVIWVLTFCLMVSARSATVKGSVILCYAWGVILLLAFPAIQTISLFEFVMMGHEELFVLSFAWHPILLWLGIFGGPFGRLDLVWYLLAGIAGNLLMSFIWFRMALETVSRFSENSGFQQESDRAEQDVKTTGTKYWIRRRPPGKGPVFNWINRWINRWMNHPQLWLELRNIASTLSRFRWMIRHDRFTTLVFILFFLILMAPSTGSLWGYRFKGNLRFFQSIFVEGICYIALIAGVMSAASSVVREVESGRLELLLTTSLSPVRFLWLRALNIFLGTLFVFMLVYVYEDNRGGILCIPRPWVGYWFGWVAPWLLLMGMLVWISLRFQLAPALGKFTRFTVTALGLYLCIFFVTFFSLFGEYYGVRNPIYWFEDWIPWIAPWLVLMGIAFWISSRVSRERTAFELTFGAACLVFVSWMMIGDFLPGLHWDVFSLDQLVLGFVVGLLFFLLAMFEVSRKQQ